MKKIILSAYACSPIRGSEPGNGWAWASSLAKSGYEVWCITNTEDKDEIEKEKEKQQLNNLHFCFVTIPLGLDKFLLDTSSKKVYLHYYLWRKSGAKKALHLHKEINFDIAHHVTFGSLQQGTFLWKLENVKLIFGPAGGGQKALPNFKRYFGKAWKTELIRNAFSNLSFKISKTLKQTLKKSAHILVTNKETEELIKATPYYDTARVHMMLDNAVPPSMENISLPEKEYGNMLQLLWVGRMLPRKGLNLVLHALSFLPEDINYQLTVIGGGECFNQLDKWISEYSLNKERLIIRGQIPFTNVIEYYKTSDIFVFCSLRDSCPAQLNEAMAFGLPPIVLDIHGSALAVPENCGIKVKATTPVETAKAIAAEIVALNRDKERLRQLSINSYNYAQKNTWKEKVDKVISNYYK